MARGPIVGKHVATYNLPVSLIQKNQHRDDSTTIALRTTRISNSNARTHAHTHTHTHTHSLTHTLSI